MNLKTTIFLLFFVIFYNESVFCQVASVTGQNICSDGSQKTTIGVSGINQEKFYVLYLDNNLLQVRRLNTKASESGISFGEFSDEGNYTVYEFVNAVENFPKSRGNAVKGNILISPVPTLFIKDTLRLKSGEKVNFLPKCNLPETSFSWTSVVKKGMVRGITKKGSGTIEDLLITEGQENAMVIYSITPFRSVNNNLCTGETRNLVVTISPH